MGRHSEIVANGRILGICLIFGRGIRQKNRVPAVDGTKHLRYTKHQGASAGRPPAIAGCEAHLQNALPAGGNRN
jgi:hypothetical protein